MRYHAIVTASVDGHRVANARKLHLRRRFGCDKIRALTAHLLRTMEDVQPRHLASKHLSHDPNAGHVVRTQARAILTRSPQAHIPPWNIYLPAERTAPDDVLETMLPMYAIRMARPHNHRIMPHDLPQVAEGILTQP